MAAQYQERQSYLAGMRVSYCVWYSIPWFAFCIYIGFIYIVFFLMLHSSPRTPPTTTTSCTHRYLHIPACIRDILPGTPIGGCRYPVLGDSIPTSRPCITILRPRTPTHAFVFIYGNACPPTFFGLALILLLLSDPLWYTIGS